MAQRGQGRYDRSQYGSNGKNGEQESSGRYYDSFYEDMLIPDEVVAAGFPRRHASDEASADANTDANEEGAEGASETATEDAVDAEQDASAYSREEDLAVSPVDDEGDQSAGGGVDELPDDFFDDQPAQARPRRGRRGSVAQDDNDAATAEGVDRGLDGAERVEQTFSRRAVEERLATSGKHPVRKKRKMGLAGRVIAIVIAAVVLVGVGVGAAYFAGISGNLHAGIGDDLRNVLVKTDMAKEPFYMLLLGTDGSAERDEDPFYAGTGYRSDSMMLARIDPVQKKATLISIGRDIQVDLGGEYGEQKINAAYAFGGPALAVQAVSKLAGVPISHYAQVDFDGFAAMVDALGGVEVDVPMAIIDDYDAGGSVPGGLQTLDGAQALILCRARNSYADVAAHPDEMRAANQRLVLSAIARKLLSSDIGTIASTVRAMSSYVSTDLELTDIVGIAQIMKGLNPDTDIYTAGVPSHSQYIDDIWYEFLDKDAWDEMMRRVKAGEPPVDEAVVDETTGTVLATAGAGRSSSAEKYAMVTVKNATDTPGLAAKVRSQLVENGFVNVEVGEIKDNFKYPETLVVYNEPGRAREAEDIVSIIGQGRAMQNDGSYLLMGTDFIVVIGDDWDTSK